MAGVINIITRRGQEQPTSTIRGEGGQFGYARGFLQLSGPLQPVNYSLSLNYNRNDEQVEDDQFELGTIGRTVNLAESDPFTAQLTGQYARTRTRSFPEGSGGSRLAILRKTEQRDTDELAVGLEFSHKQGTRWDHQLSANLFYRTQDVDNPGVRSAPNRFQIPPATFETRFTRSKLQWRHAIQVTKKWTLVGGIQVIHEMGERSGVQQLSAVGAPADQPTDFSNRRWIPSSSKPRFHRFNG